MRGILLCLLLPGLASANVSEEKAGKVKEIKGQVAQVKAWQEKDMITAGQAQCITVELLSKAGLIVGEKVESLSDLDKYLPQKSAVPESYLTFWGMVTILACIIGVVAMCWLCRIYVSTILLWISPNVYEGAAYILVAGSFLTGTFGVYLMGCLLLGPLLFLSKWLHAEEPHKEHVYLGNVKIHFLSMVALILAVVWAAVAYVHQSYFIAFMSVVALVEYLGFTVIMTPLCYAIGFSEEKKIPKTMFASAVMLVLATGAKIYNCAGCVSLDTARGVPEPWAYNFTIFIPAMLGVGTFVYYLGCLIVSSRYYCMGRDNEGHLVLNNYIELQGLAILSGVLAVFVGTVYNIGLLQGIAGVFFILYLVEKYSEIPWRKVGWAWGLLGLSVGMYFLSDFAVNNPQYFFLGGK